MTRTSTGTGARRTSAGERALVLGGLGVAALATALAHVSGTGTEHLAPVWLAALAWTVAASLGMALRRGIAHGDWSAFRTPGPAGDGGELDEWASRTGRYAWLGEDEERLRDGAGPL